MQAGETPAERELVSKGESRKEMSPGAGDKGAVVVGADLVGMAVVTFYSGNGAAKFAKKFGFQ